MKTTKYQLLTGLLVALLGLTTTIPAHAGTSGGGGGYADESSEKILRYVSNEIHQLILRATPQIFEDLPEGWNQEKFAKLFIYENIILEPNKPNIRAKERRELMFDYRYDDNGEPHIVAARSFFTATALLEVNFVPHIEVFRPKMDEIKLRMIHEAAHFLGIGQSERTNNMARAFAWRILESLDKDMILCETKEWPQEKEKYFPLAYHFSDKECVVADNPEEKAHCEDNNVIETITPPTSVILLLNRPYRMGMAASQLMVSDDHDEHIGRSDVSGYYLKDFFNKPNAFEDPEWGRKSMIMYRTSKEVSSEVSPSIIAQFVDPIHNFDETKNHYDWSQAKLHSNDTLEFKNVFGFDKSFGEAYGNSPLGHEYTESLVMPKHSSMNPFLARYDYEVVNYSTEFIGDDDPTSECEKLRTEDYQKHYEVCTELVEDERFKGSALFTCQAKYKKLVIEDLYVDETEDLPTGVQQN